MPFIIIRIVWGLWLLGFVVLALAATSNLLFAPAGTPDRLSRWLSRMILALVWPVALLSRGGRERLRRGY